MPAAACLPTVGEIARRLDEPIHRVEYILRSRAITPVGRAGHARVYSDEDVELIAEELRRIDADRSRMTGGGAL
jgi:hypothetical protein